MQPLTPPTLFKYRSAKTDEQYKILSILEGKLHFSTIKNFNDGFEYFYTYTEETWINNDQNQLVKLTPQEQIERFAPIISELKTNAGYYCLCESDRSVSMWALYANGHNGVCIGFDWNKLKNAGPWVFGEKIEYRSSPVDLDKHSAGDGWHKVFTSKHSDFAFEAEWRLRLEKPGKTSEDKKTIIKNAITQVIFGFRTTPEFREMIIKKCANEGINPDFYITSPIPGQYELEKIHLKLDVCTNEKRVRENVDQ